MQDEEEKLTEREWKTRYSTQYKERMGCIDCGDTNDSYMVTNATWHKAIPNYPMLHKERKEKGLHTALCFKCLERRIGRELVLEDFVNYPINRAVLLGIRIGQKK